MVENQRNLSITPFFNLLKYDNSVGPIKSLSWPSIAVGLEMRREDLMVLLVVVKVDPTAMMPTADPVPIS